MLNYKYTKVKKSIDNIISYAIQWFDGEKWVDVYDHGESCEFSDEWEAKGLMGEMLQKEPENKLRIAKYEHILQYVIIPEIIE